jgi:DNA-binding MarR family transcriptional regulator
MDYSTPANNNSDTSQTIPKHCYDLRIVRALRRIIRATDIHSHKLSTQYKITGPQLACLMTVKNSGPLTGGALAQNVYLSPSTVVGIVDRLEEKQLVKRERSNKDRRQVHISITATGEQLIADAPSLLQDILASALVELPEMEQQSITLSLEKLVDLMEVGHVSAAPVLETGSLLQDP